MQDFAVPGAPALKQTLTTLQLWGIAVGLVISGEYFGWSYGWASAGTLGFTVTALFIAAMYTTFIFSFTELTTMIPHAGGPFAYSKAAFGPVGGYLAGAATLIEFVFAPPAIALAIGAYLNVQFPGLDPKTAAVGAYLVFMALNIIGVQVAATFELLVTLLAIFELLVFMGVVAPGFSMAHFTRGGWSGQDHLTLAAVPGMFAAIPFAIWFFLAIEGVAMAAEEAKDPRRSIPLAYIAGILTLVVLAVGVMVFAGGAGDWTRLANINDPLPQAMKLIVGANSNWLHMLVWLGLFGLIASFHGIILGYSRQIFALAREAYLPRTSARSTPASRHRTGPSCWAAPSASPPSTAMSWSSWAGRRSLPISLRCPCSAPSRCTSSACSAFSSCAARPQAWCGHSRRPCIRSFPHSRWPARLSAWAR